MNSLQSAKRWVQSHPELAIGIGLGLVASVLLLLFFRDLALYVFGLVGSFLLKLLVDLIDIFGGS